MVLCHSSHQYPTEEWPASYSRQTGKNWDHLSLYFFSELENFVVKFCVSLGMCSSEGEMAETPFCLLELICVDVFLHL